MRIILRPTVLGLLLVGCRDPDLGPLRDELSASAAVVCAPAPERPAHAAKSREMSSAEIEALLSKLSEGQNSPDAIALGDLNELHEALVQDRAIVGQLRRNRLLVDAPQVDLDTSGKSLPSPTKLEAKRSSPAFIGLERILLLSAAAKHHLGHVDDALARCADTVALARDQVIAGGVTDMLFANSQIQLAFEQCRPFVEAAPREPATRFAQALTTLRGSFPSAIDDVVRRDRAELTLFLFGKARDPSRPFACERASTLAAVRDGKPLTRSERLALVEEHRESRASVSPPDAKYAEAYGLTLQVLDKLIDVARRR